MFPYSNPTGDQALDQQEVLAAYRMRIHQEYSRCAAHRKSAFTHLHAFDGVDATIDHVTWPAFPKIRSAVELAQIDARRSELQDEYTEWSVTRDGGRIRRVTFTSEFIEPFIVLSQRGSAAVIDGVKNVYPGANPTARELFGLDAAQVGLLSPEERGEVFAKHVPKNPWNNGDKGILFLTQQTNNMFALFELANDCATPNLAIPASEVCATTDCEAGRNSDPAICQALQLIARSDRSLSLVDPAGVTIRRLGGIWELDGKQIDMNGVQGATLWRVTRNHHRGELEVSDSLTLGGQPITTGAQVAKALEVGVSVISAPDSQLPFWARRGNESTRRV